VSPVGSGFLSPGDFLSQRCNLNLIAKGKERMDERTKELIAIGASVGAHCQPCLTYHVEKARELGIEDELIRAAIETGHMVEKGAMSAMRKFSASVLDPAPTTGCNSSVDSTPPKACCG
jgi:AhpD family alkylhydroperoxidase